MGYGPPEGHLQAETRMNRSVDGEDKPGFVILRRKSGLNLSSMSPLSEMWGVGGGADQPDPGIAPHE
jgi:hypothetical protein